MYTPLLQMLNRPSPSDSASAAPTTPTTPPPSSTAAQGTDLTTTFLKLLTIQLQNQSPLNPVDPDQFVTQLAQFDSLGALTTIQSLMQTLVTEVGGTSTTPAAPANATANPNPASKPSFNSSPLI